MEIQEKNYYLQNGRLDLTMLENDDEQLIERIPSMFKDPIIEQTLKEMGNLFAEEIN
ncbi:MAG: hypothetical protein ACRCSG_09145 [Cellulosilyticaceae bacterium]